MHFSFIHRYFRFSYLLGILIAVFSLNGYSQGSNDWRTNADIIIQQTDSLSLKSQQTFYINRVQKVDRTFKNDIPFKETWNYTINRGKIVLFQIHYVIDTLEYTEAYYLNNDRLLCMEEYESSYFSNDDQIRWGKVLFFHDNTLKLFVKVGKQKEEEMYARVGNDVLVNFDKRFSELKKNLK